MKLKHRKIHNFCRNKEAVPTDVSPQPHTAPSSQPRSSRDLWEQHFPALAALLSAQADAAAPLPEPAHLPVTQVSLLLITEGRCTPHHSEGLRRAMLPPRTKTSKSQLRRAALSVQVWGFFGSGIFSPVPWRFNDGRAKPVQFIYMHVWR